MTVQAEVQAVWPLLFVEDIEKSIAFYRDRLGFELVGEAKDAGQVFWARLKRGGASIMLQQTEPGAEDEEGLPGQRGQGVAFYMICSDANAMYDELMQRGLDIDPPTMAPYGMNQLFVPEPDGYALCFESQA